MKKEAFLKQGKKGWIKQSIIIVLFVITVLIVVTLVFLPYLKTPLQKEPLKGKYIKNATINNDGTIINISLDDVYFDNVTKMKFIFINESDYEFYYYQETNLFNNASYLINSSDVGINDFFTIKEVILDFEGPEENETIQVDVNGSTSNQTATNTSTTTGGSSGGGGGGITCTPESISKTCGIWECGIRINNCGNGVNCGTCETWEYCNSGVCVSDCTDDLECSGEGLQCDGNTVINCSVGEDGCLHKTNLTDCSSSEVCYLGGCQAIPDCTHDDNCTEFTNVCSIGLCTLGKCEVSYNLTGLCRDSIRECDQAEYCGGGSELCPADLNKSDGETCSSGNCSSGICVECIVDSDCSTNEICSYGNCINQSLLCVDGTSNGGCSTLNPPLYCDAGNLVFDATKCSADPGKCCQSAKTPAPYATFLAVNVPYSEDCSQAYNYFDIDTIGGFWINNTFYESTGLALGIGGYPTNIQCRADLAPIVNFERGVRNKTDAFIFVPWNDSRKQAQVAILDWNYTIDSYYFYNGAGFELKKISYLDCADFSGDICSLTEYCPGTSLKVADTERCCNVECLTPIWTACSECGNGLFNTCDRDECKGIIEGCYFLNNSCYPCSGGDDCFSYLADSQTCTEDVCGFQDCYWNSTTSSCEEPFDCSDITHCKNYTSSEVCLNDPCSLENCFYDGSCQADVCTDSDGNNYETYGTCFDDIIYNHTSPIGDSCNNEIITEYTCNNHYCQANDYDCTLIGGTCQNGECVVPFTPTIEIDSCTELSQANTIYKLNQSITVDIDLNDECIKITAPNIIFDCDSYSITGEDYYSGVYSDQDQTTVKNCYVSMGYGSFSSGIELRSSRDNHVYNNTLNTQGRGITLISVNDSLVEENIARNHLLDGLYSVSGNNNKFMNNIVENNSEHGIFVSEGISYNITGNTFNNNTGDGIYLTLSDDNIIMNNRANYNRMGILIVNSYNNSLIDNQFCSNTNYDLKCYAIQPTVTGNECGNINGCGGTCTSCSSLPTMSAFSRIWNFIKNIFSNIF